MKKPVLGLLITFVLLLSPAASARADDAVPIRLLPGGTRAAGSSARTASHAGPLSLPLLDMFSSTDAAPRWRLLNPPARPSPRASHAMAYDSLRGQAVLFGGSDASGTILADTWLWTSATRTWSLAQPVHSPSPRFGHSMVFDAARGVTVLFGGRAGGAFQFYNDLWMWDGSDWAEIAATGPSARWAHNMTYDSTRGVAVLFGGIADEGQVQDTWQWDGVNWTLVLMDGPSPRCCAGLAYDPLRDVTVLFGGQEDQTLGGTWERAGDGPWVQRFPANEPTPRERPAMAFYPRLGRAVMFGGEDGQYFDDTVIWDGLNLNWRTRPFNPRPAGRCCFPMVFDSVLNGLLLFGGSVSFIENDETWLFR